MLYIISLIFVNNKDEFVFTKSNKFSIFGKYNTYILTITVIVGLPRYNLKVCIILLTFCTHSSRTRNLGRERDSNQKQVLQRRQHDRAEVLHIQSSKAKPLYLVETWNQHTELRRH